MNKGIVYIVHHVDTEGPLCEPTDEILTRLQNTLGLDLNLAPTRQNLIKLQQGAIDLPTNIKKEIQKILDPQLISFKENWKDIDEMLTRITSKSYREKFKDSFENGWVYNWHIMDHVGFETNGRRRDMGYLNIFNHYESIFREIPKLNDEIQWHFHPISFNKEAHICATSYENSYYELHQILCRRLIEKQWFPQVNRAGFHTIRPDSNWFLEQWIPFDASNQEIDNHNQTQLQVDAINGRFGDWTGAPDDWSLYNPDLYDWRRQGSLNRFISRTLNLKTRFRNINEIEIEKAFCKAIKDENVYLGITNHDFREMSIEIDEFQLMLKNIVKKYPNVRFSFCPATKAFQSVIGYAPEKIKNDSINFKVHIENNTLHINITNGEPFGPQPYLAIKTISGKYIHDNLDFGIYKKEYFYTFDRQTINLSEIDKIGIASNDKYGNKRIIVLDLKQL